LISKWRNGWGLIDDIDDIDVETGRIHMIAFVGMIALAMLAH